MKPELEEIAVLLHDIQGGIRHAMRREFERLGMTMPQGMVLGAIAHLGGATIGELSDALNLSNSTVSGIVDRLESRKMVERVRGAQDKRKVTVRLTAGSRGTHDRFHRKAAEMFEKFLGNAEPGELRLIKRGLETLKRCLDRGLAEREQA